jgi:hypothetical protein
MTDEQITALVVTAESRAAILHASAAWGSDEDGHLMGKLVEVIDAQAAEIARLREDCQRARVLLLKPWSSEDVEDARFILSAALAQETGDVAEN